MQTHCRLIFCGFFLSRNGPVLFKLGFTYVYEARMHVLACARTCTRTHPHAHARMLAHARAHARAHACTHARTHARTHIHARARAHTIRVQHSCSGREPCIQCSNCHLRMQQIWPGGCLAASSDHSCPVQLVSRGGPARVSVNYSIVK